MLRGPRDQDEPRLDQKAIYSQVAAADCEVSCAQAVGSKYQTAVFSDVCFEHEHEDICDYAKQLDPTFDESITTYFNSPDRHHFGHVNPVETKLASQVADACICMLETCQKKRVDCYKEHSMAEIQMLEKNQPVCCSSKHQLKEFYVHIHKSLMPQYKGGKFDYYRYVHKHVCDWQVTGLWNEICQDTATEGHEFRADTADDKSLAAFAAHRHVHVHEQYLTPDEEAYLRPKKKKHHYHHHKSLRVKSKFKKLSKAALEGEFVKEKKAADTKSTQLKAAQLQAAHLKAASEMHNDVLGDVTTTLGKEHENIDITWAPSMAPTNTNEPTSYPTTYPTRFVSELERAYACLPDCAIYMGHAFTIPPIQLEKICISKTLAQDCESLSLNTPSGDAKFDLAAQHIPVDQATLVCSCIWDFPLSVRGRGCIENAAHAARILLPSVAPTLNPTSTPTHATRSPTGTPSHTPTREPTISPTVEPTFQTLPPTTGPTSPPTSVPLRVKLLVCFPPCAKSVSRDWSMSQSNTHKYLLTFLSHRDVCDEAVINLPDERYKMVIASQKYPPAIVDQWTYLERSQRLLFCYCANWVSEAQEGRECVAQAEMKYANRYDFQRSNLDPNQPSWFQTSVDWPEIPTMIPTAAPTKPPTNIVPTTSPSASPTRSAVAQAAWQQQKLAKELLQAMGLANTAEPSAAPVLPTPVVTRVYPTSLPTPVPTAFIPLPGLPFISSSAPTFMPTKIHNISVLSDDDDALESPDMTATADPTQQPTHASRDFSAPTGGPTNNGGDDDDGYVDNQSEDAEFKHLLKPKKTLLPVLAPLTSAPTVSPSNRSAYEVKEGFLRYFSKEGIADECTAWPQTPKRIKKCPSIQKGFVYHVAKQLKIPGPFFIAWVNGRFSSDDKARDIRAEKLLYVLAGSKKKPAATLSPTPAARRRGHIEFTDATLQQGV
jgi:hypothetical protein